MGEEQEAHRELPEQSLRWRQALYERPYPPVLLNSIWFLISRDIEVQFLPTAREICLKDCCSKNIWEITILSSNDKCGFFMI